MTLRKCCFSGLRSTANLCVHSNWAPMSSLMPSCSVAAQSVRHPEPEQAQPKSSLFVSRQKKQGGRERPHPIYVETNGESTWRGVCVHALFARDPGGGCARVEARRARLQEARRCSTPLATHRLYATSGGGGCCCSRRSMSRHCHNCMGNLFSCVFAREALGATTRSLARFDHQSTPRKQHRYLQTRFQATWAPNRQIFTTLARKVDAMDTAQ